jgi:cell shape-determining protein MreC
MKIEKEARGFWGSILVFIAIMVLLIILFWVDIPDSNNDIVKVIIGMLVSSLSVILYTIAGKNPDELEAMKREYETERKEKELLKQKNEALTARVNHLEEMFMELQKQVIDKLSVLVGKG